MARLSRLTPLAGFPSYPGPHAVGTVDVEIPVSVLGDLGGSPPTGRASTIAYRLFYPCESPPVQSRPVRWIPNPQMPVLSAYMQLLGLNSAMSGLVSLLPQHLYYVNIPALRNGRLSIPPADSGRWPVMVFSHGLGGSRNVYSHLCGSVASYGVVVVAVDHRDGSSPVQYVRATESSPADVVSYSKVPHDPTDEVYAARDLMLRIRMWEMILVLESLCRVDEGQPMLNLDPNSTDRRKKDTNDVFSMFHNRLDVHEPGKIIWGGHSFGAATTVQLLKSVYWRASATKLSEERVLLRPAENWAITSQVTPSTPTVLLDMWCLPLESPRTSWLAAKPMPCYVDGGSGGATIIAILSETFFKWEMNMKAIRRALKPPTFQQPTLGSTASASNQRNSTPPLFFYPINSAHLSQSDFGILFPRLVKVALKAVKPEYTLLLNVRAILQHLRNNGFAIKHTSFAGDAKKSDVLVVEDEAKGDWKILSSNGNVQGWVSVPSMDDTAETERVDAGPSLVQEGLTREA